MDGVNARERQRGLHERRIHRGLGRGQRPVHCVMARGVSIEQQYRHR